MVSNRKKPELEKGGQIIDWPKDKRATSYDVAKRAGVSQSAVSRCFKPGASISMRTRERVMAAAAELEYQPNAIARGLITRRSNLIAVLISARVNLYYPEVLFKLTGELAKQALHVLLFTVDSEEDAGRVIDQLWQYQADGVISASHLSLEQFHQIERRGTPIVFFNRYFKNQPSNVVYCDPEQQVDDLIGRAAALGHRRCGLILGPEGNMVGRERMRLVRGALDRYKINCVEEVAGDFTYESGATALQTLWTEEGSQPSLVIAANDMMALGALDEARGVFDLAVPRDLSLISFDGISIAQFSSYELTTIRQPIGRMAEAAVNILSKRIEEPEASNEKRVFEGAVIDGATLGEAPRL